MESGDLEEQATEHELGLETRAEPKKRSRKSRALSVTELVDQGNRRIAGHRKTLARESFTKAIELDPQCEAALLGLAMTALTEQDQCRYLKQVLEINPGNEVASRWLNSLEHLLQMREDASRRQEQRLAAQKTMRPQPVRQPVFQSSTPPDQGSARIILTLVGCILVALILFGILNASNTANVSKPSYDLGPGPGAPVRIYTGDSSLVTPSPVFSTADPYNGSYSGGSICADGTHSSSTGRGTCSHHGGVIGH